MKLEEILQKLIKTYLIDLCVLQPISNLFGGFFSILGKENR